jgi:hypothetical protein
VHEKRNPYEVFVGTSEGKRTLGRRRWECNLKMDLREIEWGGMDSILVPQDGDQWRALVNTGSVNFVGKLFNI